MKNGKVLNGREAWKGHRELIGLKFLKAVKDATGSDRFTYVTAVP